MRSGRPRTTSSGPSPRLQHQGLLSGNSGITFADTLKYARIRAERQIKAGELPGGWFDPKDWDGWQKHMEGLIHRLDGVLALEGSTLELSSSTGADCPGINHVGRERRKLNPFGQELRKILTQCKTSGVVSYAGRSAYIQLDPDLRARLEFVSLNIAGQYNALKLTILNRTEGAVDVNILRFGDLLGKKKKKVSNPQLLGWYLTTPLGRLWEGRLVCLPAYSGGLQAAGGYGGRISAGVPASGGRRRNTARKCAKKIGSEYKQGPCPATAPVPLSRSMRPMLARSPLRKGVKPPDVYIGLFFLGGLMDQFIDWVYSQLVGFFGNFFAEMGNMGVELFEMSWVQSIVLFFFLIWPGRCMSSGWWWPCSRSESNTRPDGPVSRTRLSAPSRALWPWGVLPWCRWNFINSPSRCRPA